MMNYPYTGVPTESGRTRLFTLRNASGMTVAISERGAALCSWRAPDRYGRMAEVLLADPGGPAAAGLPGARWHGRHAEGGVALLRIGPGGTADLLVIYRLADDGSLTIDYRAMASLPATLRVKSHPYFNLNGGYADVGDHQLQIDADFYGEADAGGAPVGVAVVAGTAFDFRHPGAIGPRLRWPETQIRLAGGFDHSYFVRSHVVGGQGALREVARVYDPGSGRRLQVCTTEAALQFSTGRRNGPDWCRNGFGLEAFASPGLMSAAWPHIILSPGQRYRQITVYRLSLQT